MVTLGLGLVLIDITIRNDVEILHTVCRNSALSWRRPFDATGPPIRTGPMMHIKGKVRDEIIIQSSVGKAISRIPLRTPRIIA